MNSKLTLLAISLFALTVVLFTSQNASAGLTNTNLPVSSVVSSNCFVTSSPLNFTYSSGQAGDSTALGSINVDCNNGTIFTIDLNEGANASVGATYRNMTDGTNLLAYYLYWTLSGQLAGTTINNGFTISGTGAGFGFPQIMGLLGNVPGSQAVPPGTYNDTVVATVSW